MGGLSSLGTPPHSQLGREGSESYLGRGVGRTRQWMKGRSTGHVPATWTAPQTVEVGPIRLEQSVTVSTVSTEYSSVYCSWAVTD